MRRISQDRLQDELCRIVESLKCYEPLKIILFGSFARGDYHALSDVDLLIVKDTDRSFIDRIGDVLRCCESTLSIEPLVYTSAELTLMTEQGNSFLAEVLKEGVTIYERESA